jgi:hypothetical protein
LVAVAVAGLDETCCKLDFSQSMAEKPRVDVDTEKKKKDTDHTTARASAARVDI